MTAASICTEICLRSASASCPSISTFSERENFADRTTRRRPSDAPENRLPRAGAGLPPPRQVECRDGTCRLGGGGGQAGARARGDPPPLLRCPWATSGRDARLLRAALPVSVRVPDRLAGERDRSARRDLGISTRPQPRV